jgi:hypothetical protein
MRIPTRHPERVPQDHEVAVTAGVPAGRDDATRRGGPDAHARVRQQVDARVKLVPPGPEAVAHRGVDRNDEAQRRPRRRPPQGRQRDRTHRAVGGKACPHLEAAQRRGRARPEAPVYRTGRKPVGGEQELQRCHIPAPSADDQRPRAQRRPAPPTEGAAGPRAGDAIHSEAASRLQATDRRPGRRTADAVHRPAIEPLGAQRNLQRGDVGRPPGRRRRGGDDERDGDDR